MKTKNLLKICLILTILLLTVSQVSAANTTINNNQSIQDTIDNLNDNDELYLEPGIYTQTGIEINKTLTIQGLGEANQVIIDGENKNSTIFTITSENIKVTFKNISFINGNSPDRGGAISSYMSPVIVDNCIFENNTAESFGGAIGVDSTYIIVNNTLFYNNLANYDGGALSVKRVPGSIIENTQFINNTAPTGWGGTFYNWYCGMTINNCTITGGLAEVGGGIFNSGNLIMINSIIVNNKATDSAGGLYNYHNSSIINNCSIFNNTALHGADILLYRTTNQSNYDDNWWGVNNPINSTEYPLNWSKRYVTDYDQVIGNPQSWLEFNTTISNNILTASLKNNKEENINLPLNIKVESQLVNTETTLKNGISNIELKQTEENQTIKTTSDYQVNYNILSGTLNNTVLTILASENLVKIYGNDTPLRGKLTDTQINPIAGQHILITLSRVSNNQEKTYDVVTDYNGIFTLPINLAQGEYKATIKYNGLTNKYEESGPITKNILILKDNTENINTYTFINLEKYNQTILDNKNLTGYLTNFDTTPLSGQHIKLTLSNLKGQSKTYELTTDYNGMFTLPINLGQGEYIGQATYEGTSQYQSITTRNTITVRGE